MQAVVLTLQLAAKRQPVARGEIVSGKQHTALPLFQQAHPPAQRVQHRLRAKIGRAAAKNDKRTAH